MMPRGPIGLSPGADIDLASDSDESDDGSDGGSSFIYSLYMVVYSF